MKDYAQGAATKATESFANKAPGPVNSCTPSPLDHNRAAKEQRLAAAKRVFPGKQNYSNCGLQAAAQVIHQATGKPKNEENLLREALSSGLAQRGTGKFESGPVEMEDVDRDPLKWGGTGQWHLQQFLGANGVPASMKPTTVENLKDAILSRQGIIAEVDVSELWKPTSQSGGHAIVVTDGIFDDKGTLKGVRINDTGMGQQGRAVPIKDFLDACYAHQGGSPKLVVTDAPIWP